MSIRKIDFVLLLDFVRRERVYFLAILLCLLITFILSGESQPPVEPPASAALQQLEARADRWNQSEKDVAVLVRYFETNPVPVIAWLGTMAVFSALFLSGCLIVILRWSSLSVRNYFTQKAEPFHPVYFSGTCLFRVGALTYVSLVLTMLVSGVLSETGLMNENGLGITQTLLLDGLVCFSIFAVIREFGISWKSFMGEKPKSIWAEIVRGLAEYASFFPWFILSMVALLAAAAFFNYEPPTHPLIEVFLEEEKGSPWIFYGAILLAAIIAPVLEEIFFRGFIYRFLKGVCGIGYAVVFSAGFFAALHGYWFTLLPIFILGVVLARLYEKRGSFIACWTFHVLHNILFTVYFFSAKAMLEAFHG